MGESLIEDSNEFTISLSAYQVTAIQNVNLYISTLDFSMFPGPPIGIRRYSTFGALVATYNISDSSNQTFSYGMTSQGSNVCTLHQRDFGNFDYRWRIHRRTADGGILSNVDVDTSITGAIGGGMAYANNQFYLLRSDYSVLLCVNNNGTYNPSGNIDLPADLNTTDSSVFSIEFYDGKFYLLDTENSTVWEVEWNYNYGCYSTCSVKYISNFFLCWI